MRKEKDREIRERGGKTELAKRQKTERKRGKYRDREKRESFYLLFVVLLMQM